MSAGQEPVGTLAAAIAEGAREHADVRVVFDGPAGVRTTTVGSLVADAERMAGALQGLGVQPGDVVAVQAASSYEGAVVAAGVARQKTPERLEIVATLPRTPSGKVPKHVLLEQLTG